MGGGWGGLCDEGCSPCAGCLWLCLTDAAPGGAGTAYRRRGSLRQVLFVRLLVGGAAPGLWFNGLENSLFARLKGIFCTRAPIPLPPQQAPHSPMQALEMMPDPYTAFQAGWVCGNCLPLPLRRACLALPQAFHPPPPALPFPTHSARWRMATAA